MYIQYILPWASIIKKKAFWGGCSKRDVCSTHGWGSKRSPRLGKRAIKINEQKTVHLLLTETQ